MPLLLLLLLLGMLRMLRMMVMMVEEAEVCAIRSDGYPWQDLFIEMAHEEWKIVRWRNG